MANTLTLYRPDPQEEERKRRMDWGKSQGLDDATIQKYELIAKVQQQNQQRQAQAQSTPQKQGPSTLKKVLVNGGALVGSLGAGAAAVLAAPVTGGASIAGGFAAGAGIEALRRKALGEKQSLGASALEGGLTILPGAAKGIKALSGAAKAGTSVEKKALTESILKSRGIPVKYSSSTSTGVGKPQVANKLLVNPTTGQVADAAKELSAKGYKTTGQVSTKSDLLGRPKAPVVTMTGNRTTVPLSQTGKTERGIIKTPDTFATKVTPVANDANKEKNLLKQLITPSQKAQEGNTVTTKLGQNLSKQSTIAPTSTIGSASQQNKLVRLAQQEPLLAGSSNRKFQNVEKVIANHTDAVDTLLKGVKQTVPASDLQKGLATASAAITDPSEAKAFQNVLGRIQKAIGNKTSYSALDINEARRVINKELGSVERKTQMGSTLTALDRALQDAHGSFTEALNKLAPKEVGGQVKDLNSRISTFIKGQPEFKKKSESADLLGMRGQLVPKIPVIKPLLEGATDIAGRGVSKAGRALSTPLGQQAQVVPFNLAAMGGGTQAQPTQLPSNIGDVFPNAQHPDEVALNQIAAAGITDPQEMFDALSGQGKYAQTTPEQATPSRSAQYADLADKALQQGDLKTAKSLMDFATTAAALEKSTKAASGGAGGPNITKVTAQQYGLAQSGQGAVQQLKGILQQDPGVLDRARTPGRGIDLLGIGGSISNAAGTGKFDAVGYNIADSILRLRTGATANESEVRKLQAQIMPRPGDSPETINTKLAQIDQIFNGVLDVANKQPSDNGLGDISNLLNSQSQGY